MKLPRLRKLLKFLLANKQSRFLDLLAVGGFCSLVWGCFLAYQPLGWIVGGILPLLFALVARRPPKDGKEN